MNTIVRMLTAAALISLPTLSDAQKENPRGIYKMTTLTGKLGEVKAPFDQYKVCTDSVTLTLSAQNSSFNIGDNDRQVFYYTGDQSKVEGNKLTLIYDSNADHFTLKWWSQYANHLHFPNNGWCIEKYESGQYSETARLAFDALTATPAADATNPLIGTWRVLGYVDELRDVKKELPNLTKNHATSRYANSFYVFMPRNLVLVAVNRGGTTAPVEYDNKNAFKLGGTTVRVKWLGKNRIALEEQVDYRTDWQILERVTDGPTLLSRIASRYVKKQK